MVRWYMRWYCILTQSKDEIVLRIVRWNIRWYRILSGTPMDPQMDPQTDQQRDKRINILDFVTIPGTLDLCDKVERQKNHSGN